MRKQAFTLIELLIVIAIIGILFIVLVSKVDFATDKATASGVQTDFRSFQMAFDTVAKENAGFNTFGWDTGDLNQDGKRNSYDEGDNGAGGGTANNGVQDGTEVFTGHKVYAETFTKVYSLKKAKSDGTLETNYDREALNRLETAINANLDPKLHITIKDDGEIVMANGAKDPWNKEYHGWYITNAETDKADRGAIVMYSDGANNEFGSEHTIANGVVKIIIPGDNKAGKDDYSIVSCYTYLNGYGEVKNVTTGFSNNQSFLGGNQNEDVNVNPSEPNETILYSIISGANATVEQGKDDLTFVSDADFNKFVSVKIDNNDLDANNYEVSSGSTKVVLTKEYIGTLSIGQHTIEIVSSDGLASCSFYISEPTISTAGLYRNGVLVKSWDNILSEGILKLDANGMLTNGYSYYHSTNNKADLLDGDLILPDDGTITSLGYYDEYYYAGPVAFAGFSKLKSVNIPSNIETLPVGLFYNCYELRHVDIPEGVKSIEMSVFAKCYNLVSVTLPSTLETLPDGSIMPYCVNITEVVNKSSLDLTQYSRAFTTGNYPPVFLESEAESQLRYVGEHVFKIDGENIIYYHNYASNSTTILPDSYNGKAYSIGYGAFMNNSVLENIIIPDTVISIDGSFTLYCSNLKSITILGDKILLTSNGSTLSTSNLTNVHIYVPEHMVDAYKEHQVWKNFIDKIQPIS